MPYRSYKTLDGDILFGGGNDRLFGVLCDRLGHPEWKTDPRFGTNSDRVKHRTDIDGLIEETVKQKTTQEWLEILEGSGMPYAAVNDIQGTLNHSHGTLYISNVSRKFINPLINYMQSKHEAWLQKLTIQPAVPSSW